MATEFTLRRQDHRPLGTFEKVQATVRRVVPGVQFRWTTSGPKKVEGGEERRFNAPAYGGVAPEMNRLLDALEAEYGNTLVVSGSEPDLG